jgi:hypothetical protein
MCYTVQAVQLLGVFSALAGVCVGMLLGFMAYGVNRR